LITNTTGLYDLDGNFIHGTKAVHPIESFIHYAKKDLSLVEGMSKGRKLSV